MALKQFVCQDCDHEFEYLSLGKDDKPQCSNCQSLRVAYKPGGFGGYSIKGDNSASVRPKGAGSKPHK